MTHTKLRRWTSRLTSCGQEETVPQSAVWCRLLADEDIRRKWRRRRRRRRSCRQERVFLLVDQRSSVLRPAQQGQLATSPTLVRNEHTHTFNGPLSGTPRWAGTRKVKPVWISLKQETVSGSGISWARCKSAPCSRQITHASTPPLCFLQAGCPSCRPTNSVKVLKVQECSENYNK